MAGTVITELNYHRGCDAERVYEAPVVWVRLSLG
jgi:hypothetical protein